jgi:hypothetical protein
MSLNAENAESDHGLPEDAENMNQLRALSVFLRVLRVERQSFLAHGFSSAGAGGRATSCTRDALR